MKNTEKKTIIFYDYPIAVQRSTSRTTMHYTELSLPTKKLTPFFRFRVNVRLICVQTTRNLSQSKEEKKKN